MEDIVIRDARKEDCSELRRLIQELADYHGHMPNGTKIDADKLEEDGFGSDPYFRCIVAEHKNGSRSELVGYALFYYTYSTWEGKSLYLEDLYVTPGQRAKGLGSKLFTSVTKRGLEKGCCRLDFVVLDWNPAREFYNQKGAMDLTEKEGWHHYRMNREAMEKLNRS